MDTGKQTPDVVADVAQLSLGDAPKDGAVDVIDGDRGSADGAAAGDDADGLSNVSDDADDKPLVGTDNDNAGDGGIRDDSDDLSDISEDPPPPVIVATIYRQKRSDPSNMAKLGVNEVMYRPHDKIFVAHPAGSPTTPALVAKAPVPSDGEGMSKPEVVQTPKRLYKVVVILRDHSQEANLLRLELGDSTYQLVEEGRRRCFIFLFKYKWEADLFSYQYFEASLPAPSSGSGEESTSDEASSSPDIFEPSQDMFQIVRDHTAKAKKNSLQIQPRLKEDSDTEAD